MKKQPSTVESNPAQPKGQFVPAIAEASSPQPVKSLQDEWLEAFETDFWRDYPRKICKFMARKAFLRIKPWNQETCDAIFAGLDRWVNHWRDNEIDRQFIPYPATWLNQHRWEDEPDA